MTNGRCYESIDTRIAYGIATRGTFEAVFYVYTYPKSNVTREFDPEIDMDVFQEHDCEVSMEMQWKQYHRI